MKREWKCKVGDYTNSPRTAEQSECSTKVRFPLAKEWKCKQRSTVPVSNTVQCRTWVRLTSVFGMSTGVPGPL